MDTSIKQSDLSNNPLREQIAAALNHLDHVLPGQAPIHDFVHHNTLHGFQHLPFEEALADYEKLTGICGYLPEAASRNYYQQGRINSKDLSNALASNPGLQAEQHVCTVNNKSIYRKDIYFAALQFDLNRISSSQLKWQIEELGALNTVQGDVPEKIKQQLLINAPNQNKAIQSLWTSIVSGLNLQQTLLHPENMLDLSIEQAEEWLINALPNKDIELRRLFGASIRQHYQDKAQSDLDSLINQVGDSLTLRGLIQTLCHIDILDSIRPQLIRICASAMDEGVAAWQLPERRTLGLYAAWRATVRFDANPFLHELPDWQQMVTELPKDAIDTILWQLTKLEIPTEKWTGYLRRLALEIPGWSGIVNWRQHHPNYHADNDAKPTLADYLAIRLTLDRLWLNQICRNIWQTEANLGSIQNYFRKNLSEFIVRKHLHQGNLPEYLTEQAESLSAQSGSERHNRSAWQTLADLIWTWQLSPMTKNDEGLSLHDQGWRLFRLFQHLGINAEAVQHLSKSELLNIINILNNFDVPERSKIWLTAYENHYRDDFFQALHVNHNRGRWSKREKRPESQIICCMDDREESFRRHLEELNPNIETLGAAGFFGVAMNFQGLDEQATTPLCPVVVTPAHNVYEAPRPGNQETLSKHELGRSLTQRSVGLLFHSLRRNLISSFTIINAIAPFTFVGLITKSLAPRTHTRLISNFAETVSPTVKTELNFTSTDQIKTATADHPQSGFTDLEQADRVAGFLRNTGLTYNFAPLVVLMGHGSLSQNNPHLAAYDCGACSGRHGGPNARVFAAMANRPEIRALLVQRGIHIPEDTWFIGSEHNTCNEDIIWYDLDDLPASLHANYKKLLGELNRIRAMSAHERCRRLASAPRNPKLQDALNHIKERADDFSQARPELGHATNAAAIVGRRSLSQGIFLDRRVFLISYDPTQDPEGLILENILLAVGPVGAGINLEYYFSTVNNERFGCGSKVPHNITGFFAVMEGASGDLRTGLPQQMVEIHEAMRLQILVEAKTSIVELIYHRQEALRELIAGGWIHLSTKDPENGAIHVFNRETGFILWQANSAALPSFETSVDCYRNQTRPISPALIMQP